MLSHWIQNGYGKYTIVINTGCIATDEYQDLYDIYSIIETCQQYFDDSTWPRSCHVTPAGRVVAYDLVHRPAVHMADDNS